MGWVSTKMRTGRLYSRPLMQRRASTVLEARGEEYWDFLERRGVGPRQEMDRTFPLGNLVANVQLLARDMPGESAVIGKTTINKKIFCQHEFVPKGGRYSPRPQRVLPDCVRFHRTKRAPW
jgi:hypothetical protein